MAGRLSLGSVLDTCTHGPHHIFGAGVMPLGLKAFVLASPSPRKWVVALGGGRGLGASGGRGHLFDQLFAF